VEALEDPTLLSTCVVNSLGDSGAGTGLTGDLRYCITQANASPGDDTIAPSKEGAIVRTWNEDQRIVSTAMRKRVKFRDGASYFPFHHLSSTSVSCFTLSAFVDARFFSSCGSLARL